MQFCCSSQFFQRYPPQKAIAAVASCGFDSIDLWATPGRAQHVDPNQGGEHFADICQEVETHGMNILALSAYGVHGPEKGLSQLLQCLAAARELRAKVLITSSGFKKGAMSLQDYAKYLRPLVHKASDAGVVVAVENHVNGMLESPEDCVRLTDSFGSQYLGIAFTGHHFHSAGFEPQAALETLAERVRIFYAWDKKVGVPKGEFELGGAEDQMPGRGQIDFRAALAFLQSRLPQIQPVVYWRGMDNWDYERILEAVRKAREYLAGCLAAPAQ